MREQNPFGVYPRKSIADKIRRGAADLFNLNNYLEIEAKAQLLGSGDVLLEEVPFAYDDKARTFIPLNRHARWEQVQELAVLIELKYDLAIIDQGSGEGKYKISQSWRVKYGDKGITLEAGLLQDLGSKGDGDFAVAVDVVTDQPTAEAMLTATTLLLKLTGGFTSEGVTVSVGPVSGSMGGSSGVYSKAYKFKLGLLASGRPKPAIQLPDDLLNHTVWFDRENQSDLDPVELRRLEDKWLDPLRSRAPDVVSAIERKECLIHLVGYASATGRSDQYNLELSSKRILSVENALASMFDNKDLWVISRSAGRSAAKQGGPSPQEKRVEIHIPRNDAERAIASARS